MPTTDALRDLRLGDPVIETGESGMRGERGTVVASASRPGELAVLWHSSERLPAGLQTGITHGARLDVDALLARVAEVETERRAANLAPAARDVLAERVKQRAKWGDENDDKHTDGTLATAAMALAGNLDPGGEGWIIDLVRKHAGNPRRRLVLAAAFALAEIERLDRATGGSDA